MRRIIAIAAILFFAGTISAQVRTGNIYGTVADTEGNPLPGVTVTLTGLLTAPMDSLSSVEGIFRFVSLPPAKDYNLKAALDGFNTEVKENIIVVVGVNVEINFTLEMSTLAEEVTVTAVTPLIDLKQTTVGMNVTQEILQSLPTARDPWVILQMAPSVMTSEENVGGNKSGQQQGFRARGASGGQNVWTMDGVVFTDPAAIGAAPTYFDYDAFEEMQITVGGADVTIQTGGVVLNLVTRRGGNRVSLGGRFYLVDSKFQAQNEDYLRDLREQEPGFAGINKIRENKDYGFNLGFPIVPDKAWFWGSWGVQDIKTNTVYDEPDDTVLQNIVAKLNLQIIPENRFEAFMHVGRKNKWGRSGWYGLPAGYYQGGKYHFGSPMFKLQDEHMFGDNLFVSAKANFFNGAFHLTPMDDRDFVNTPFWDDTRNLYEGPDGKIGEWRYYADRPVTQFMVLANYFNDTLLGASHDVKIGVEYADRNAYNESVYNGNMQINWNYNSSTIDFTGDGLPDVPPDDNFYRLMFWRGHYRDYGVRAFAAFFSDTITFGRFNLLLGLRYDYQKPQLNGVAIEAVTDSPAWDVADPQTKAVLEMMLPDVNIAQAGLLDIDGSTYAWKVWSPRLGVTWDVTGDGRTIAKLSFSRYGNFLGTGTITQMPGGTSGWMDYWWWDNSPDTGRAPDGIIHLDELYWHSVGDGSYTPLQLWPSGSEFQGDWNDAAGSFWGGYDYQNPVELTDSFRSLDGAAGSPVTWEVLLTLEREVMTDFAITLNATFRRYDNFNWNLKEFLSEDGGSVIARQQQDWYTDWNLPLNSIAPYLPEGYTSWDGDLGEAPNNPYQYLKSEFIDPETGATINPSAYSPFVFYTKRPDFHRDYYGIDLIFNKRLSNRWMLQGSLTLQDLGAFQGDKGYMSASNVWALEGRIPAQDTAAAFGVGYTTSFTFSRWLVKLGGLFQLPYDFNASYTFHAREGFLVREAFQITDYTIPNPRNRTHFLYLNPYGDERLDPFYKLDLRLEKVFRSGDFGRIYVMFDLFNALNGKHEIRRYNKEWGRFYYYGQDDSRNYFAPRNPAFTLYEVLNPRVLRLGVRFQF